MSFEKAEILSIVGDEDKIHIHGIMYDKVLSSNNKGFTATLKGDDVTNLPLAGEARYLAIFELCKPIIKDQHNQWIIKDDNQVKNKETSISNNDLETILGKGKSNITSLT